MQPERPLVLVVISTKTTMVGGVLIGIALASAYYLGKKVARYDDRSSK